MKVKIAALALLATLFFLAACASSEPKPAPPAGNFANPNGTSELAKLMDDLFTEAEQAKAKIAVGEKPKLKLKAEHILTAAATEPEKVASDEYKLFAESYLASVKLYKDCSAAEAPEKFKAMATACMNCHQAICPGPTRRIKKLF